MSKMIRLIFCVAFVGSMATGAALTDPPTKPVDGKVNSLQGSLDELKSANADVRLKAMDFLVQSAGPNNLIAMRALRDRLLNDEDFRVRERAAHGLRRMGPSAAAALKDLIEIFEDEEEPPAVREACIRALGDIGPRARTKMIPLLIAALNDPDLADSAFEVIVTIDPDSSPLLLEKLKRKEIVLTYSMIFHFGKLKPWKKEAIPILIEHANDDDYRVRKGIASVLAELDSQSPEAAKVLAKALADKDVQVREFAARSLGSFAPVSRLAVPELVTALKDPEARVRKVAVETLGRLGPEAKDAVPQLVRMLRTESDDVRQDIVASLGKMRSAAKPAGPVLAKLVDEVNRKIAVEAIRALGKVGADAKDAAPALIRALQAPDPAVKKLARESLTTMGDGAAFPLSELLKDKSPEQRRMALEILQAMGPDAEGAIPALRAALKDFEPDAKGTVVTVLGRIGPPAKVAMNDIVALLEDKKLPKGLRNQAASTLANFGVDGDISKKLIALTKNEFWEIRSHAAAALGGGDESVVPVLKGLLKDSNRFVIIEATKALQAIEANKLLAPVLADLRSPDAAKRRKAALSLAAKDRRRRDILPELLACLKDPVPATRIEAVRFLKDVYVLAPLSRKDRDDIFDALVQSFREGPPEARTETIDVLKRIDPQLAYTLGVR